MLCFKQSLVYSKATALICFFVLIAQLYGAAQQVKTTGGFLLMNGKDTLTIERFTRTGSKVEGRLLVRKQISIVYNALFTQDHRLNQLHIQVLKPGAPEEAPPMQSSVMVFEQDSIYTTSQVKDTIKKEVIPTKAGALAYHSQLPMIALLEQIIMRGRTINGQRAEVPVFILSSRGTTTTAVVNFTGNDSAILQLGNIRVNAHISGKGEILSGYTNNGQTIQRVNNIPDAALSASAPDYSAPPGATYTAEEVRINTKAGHILAGTLTIPKNATKPVPVVITITGSSPQDRDNNTPYGGPYRIYRQLADELGKRGIAVLRMDDRGIGQSTGNFETATTADRAEDIKEGMQFVQQRKDIDINKIFLVGLSEGAVIAPMIAQNNQSLSGIVLLAGSATKGDEIMVYQLKNNLDRAASLSAEEKKKVLQEQIELVQKEAATNPWIKYFLNYDPMNAVRRINKVPVLIMHGTTDKNVPPSDAEKLAKGFKAAGNKDVTLKILTDVNHIFVADTNGDPKNYQNLKSFEVVPEALQTIGDWIENRIKR